MTSASDWLRKVEGARAEGSARRGREALEREGMLRRGGQALAQSGAATRLVQGRGVDTRTRKSVMGFGGGEMLRTKAKVEEDRGGGGRQSAAGGFKSGASLGGGSSRSALRPERPVFAPPVSGNAKLATGHQPVVIKVISYAGGARRAGATAKYVQRDEVVLETQDSQLLANHAAVEAEINHWAETFDTRKPSQDVVTLGLRIPGLVDDDAGRWELKAALETAFAGHTYAWRYESAGEGKELSVKAVVVMAGLQERFRVEEQSGVRRFTLETRKALEGRLGAAGMGAAQIEAMGTPGHGREGASYQLRKLVGGGEVQVGDKTLHSVQEAKDVAREWAGSLRSHGPRDTMHMVLSAKIKSPEDPVAFKLAVRDFLHETFPDHKFMFGLHGDKVGRIHAHVVVAVRGDNGEKLRPDRLTFLAWRQSFAEKAQEQGLKLVATVARQQASSQSYGKFDKAIVDAADNPRPGREAADLAYNRRFPHVAAAARHRMSVAKANPPTWAVTEKQRAIAGASLAVWQEIAKAEPQNAVAKDQVKRLETAMQGGQVIGQLLELSAKAGPSSVPSKQSETFEGMKKMVRQSAESLLPEARDAFERRSAKILGDFASRMEPEAINTKVPADKEDPQKPEQGQSAQSHAPTVAVKLTPDQIRARQEQVMKRLEAEAEREGPERTKPTRQK